MKKTLVIVLALVFLLAAQVAMATEYRLESGRYYLADRGNDRVVLYTSTTCLFSDDELPGVRVYEADKAFITYMGYERVVTRVNTSRLANHLPPHWSRQNRLRIIEPERYGGYRNGRREPHRPYKRRTARPYYEDEIEDIIADRSLDFFDDVLRRSFDDMFDRMF